MSMTVNMHGLETVEATSSGSTSWLHMKAKDGSHMAVFMPYAIAVAMQAAFRRAKAEEHEEKWRNREEQHGDAAIGGAV